jgi:hypothetical protein
MSVSQFYIKQGDTSPALSITLMISGTTWTIPAGSTATLAWVISDNSQAPQYRTASITNQMVTPGVVTYQWAQGEPGIAANYIGEVKVATPDGNSIRFPNSGYFDIIVSKGL